MACCALKPTSSGSAWPLVLLGPATCVAANGGVAQRTVSFSRWAVTLAPPRKQRYAERCAEPMRSASRGGLVRVRAKAKVGVRAKAKVGVRSKAKVGVRAKAKARVRAMASPSLRASEL